MGCCACSRLKNDKTQIAELAIQVFGGAFSCLGILTLFRVLLCAETEPIHYFLFGLPQLARRAVLHGQHIPSRTVRHPAFSRFYQGQVFVHAAAVAETVGPAGLIRETLALRPKRLDDFNDQFGLAVGVTVIHAREYIAGTWRCHYPLSSMKTKDLDSSAFAMMKKYESRCDEWSGFGWDIASARTVDVTFFVSAPWTHDAQMERLVKDKFRPGRRVDM